MPAAAEIARETVSATNCFGLRVGRQIDEAF